MNFNWKPYVVVVEEVKYLRDKLDMAIFKKVIKRRGMWQVPLIAAHEARPRL